MRFIADSASRSSAITVRVKTNVDLSCRACLSARSKSSVTAVEKKPRIVSVKRTPVRAGGAAVGGREGRSYGSVQPRSFAISAQARSATAEIVKSGLTPSERGMIEPSIT